MSGPALLDSVAKYDPCGAVTIHTMSPEELQTAVDWAADEGWNPGINDAQLFYQADPRGFFVALNDGKPIGCCSAVVYEQELAFFGLFIVRPDFRKRGVGLELTRAAMEHVGRCNCGLDGVVAMQSKYADFGFQPAYRNIRHEGCCDGRWQEDVVRLDTLPFDELEAYDRRHFSVSRRDFLRGWISQPGSSALGFVREGKLAGYGVLRPCQVGYKIGPLFADTDRIADALFQSLCTDSCGASVFLDTPEPNEAAVALARRYGMRPCFETARMYTKQVPDFPLDRVFGVTTFELG
jgi:GNAT superfamily N-acetyltransferase